MKTTRLALNRGNLSACSGAAVRWSVAQIFNLLYRRIVFGRALASSQRAGTRRAVQIGNLRYGRLQICAAPQPALAIWLLLAALAVPVSPTPAATNDLTTAIQRGLFEEEANQNLGAAIQAYQSVAAQFDKDRKLAATAIFRLGECYRKQGNTNEAAAQYERVLHEFSDQPTLVTLSRQNLAGLGSAPAAPAAPVLSDAARQEQKRLLEEEIKLVQKQLDSQQKQVQAGIIPSDAIVPTERELLKLKRQLAALDAGQPISIAATEIPAPATSTDADEVKRIQALIKDSPDLINAPDRKGETLLQSAAAKGKLAVVKLLLDSGATVDGLQQPGLTALHYAAANGHKAVVDLLLSKGAKADAQTEEGVTPLHLAARKGYETVAKTLLAAGAPVSSPTKAAGSCDNEDLQYAIGSRQTPLHLAASAGYASLVELLLAKGADANAVDGADRTALSYAAQKRYGAVLQLLLAAHANPNAGRFDLPLLVAACLGDVPALKLLLANGADPNATNALSYSFSSKQLPSLANTWYTPLSLAVRQDHPEAVAELIRGKADPNGLDADGTPLLALALGSAPTLKALLEGGADPNQLEAARRLLVLAAVQANNQPAVELLLAHHADANAANPNRWTPLHSAAASGPKAIGIAELLLKAGAVVNAKGASGKTPLHVAVENNQREFAEWLLARQADPNAKDNDGQTPLHYASNNGKRELAELLLAHNADPNQRDNSGHTPLDLAKSAAQPPRPGMAMPGSPPPIFDPLRAARGPVPEQESKPQAMADLLRQHGASDDLPRVDCIEVRRPLVNYSSIVFTKGTNNWNQFSLLELIAVHYGFLTGWPNGESRQSGQPGVAPGLRFPDFAHLRLRRPSADLKSWEEKTVDLTASLKSTNCAADVHLAWGDVIEIPESDHPLDQSWAGFSMADFATLKECLTRQVEIVIKGQSTNITLPPDTRFVQATPFPISPLSLVNKASFWIKPVLRDSGLLLASSDLSRVKVTRRDPAKGQTREWVVDCSFASPAPDFWLRDSDKIEVPEKTYASAAAQPEAPQAAVPLQYQWRADQPPQQAVAAEAPQAAPPRMAPPPSPAAEQATRSFSQRLANIVQRVPAAQTPEAARGWYLDVGAVRYSPKADDPVLLNAGYHKDHSAKTRQAELWEQRATSDLQGRSNTAVWTGSDMVVFGGESMGTTFDDGARYCLAEDTWAMLPSKGAPSSRTGHAMVWTGKEVIVWGGFGGVAGLNTNHNDGARYNPSTDTWKPVSTKNAPAARFDFSAIWTGREMLVWGGYTDAHSRYQGAHADAYLNSGSCYAPSSNTWKTMATNGAPSSRSFNSVVWTGKEMIVWGGNNASKVFNDGGRYNPARDAWKPVSTDGAPSPRGSHVAVWTGREMIIWGGSAREPGAASDYFENGARYNPETDTWKPISTIGAPKGRVSVSAVWTGTEMVLWGGVNAAQTGEAGDANRFVGTGARYNPVTDTWTEITLTGAPSPRWTSVVWTGEGLLTFGGYDGTHLNDTWFYSPQRTLFPYVKE